MAPFFNPLRTLQAISAATLVLGQRVIFNGWDDNGCVDNGIQYVSDNNECILLGDGKKHFDGGYQDNGPTPPQYEGCVIFFAGDTCLSDSLDSVYGSVTYGQCMDESACYSGNCNAPDCL